MRVSGTLCCSRRCTFSHVSSCCHTPSQQLSFCSNYGVLFGRSDGERLTGYGQGGNLLFSREFGIACSWCSGACSIPHRFVRNATSFWVWKGIYRLKIPIQCHLSINLKLLFPPCVRTKKSMSSHIHTEIHVFHTFYFHV